MLVAGPVEAGSLLPCHMRVLRAPPILQAGIFGRAGVEYFATEVTVTLSYMYFRYRPMQTASYG